VGSGGLKKLIEIGDDIRVIPPNSIQLSKHELNSNNAFYPADAETNETVMLGGRYTVRGVRYIEGYRYFEVLAHPKYSGLVYEGNAVLAGDVPPCPFRAGDLVVYEKLSESEQRVHQQFTDERLDDTTEHRVSRVLNDYYVFIGDSIPYPWPYFRPALRSEHS
jgi:hypothetical protein